MKKYGFCFSALFLAFALLLSIPAFAVSRASDQLSDYDMNAIATGDGEIAIKFSVRSLKAMAKIGSSSIAIFEDMNGHWLPVGYFDMDDPDMIETDVNYYADTVYFSGSSGTDYKIVVEIYAEDYAGESDSRSETFYVTA